eukprot:Skav219269  [mRNA]  locus=scaffold1380:113422:115910:- [translate_table: standard]
MHTLGQQFEREAANLQILAKKQLQTLGVDNEGCQSSLLSQTMKQVRFAVKSLKLLAHRFEVGGLPKPDGTSLLKSLARIRKSFKDARAGCSQASVK